MLAREQEVEQEPSWAERELMTLKALVRLLAQSCRKEHILLFLCFISFTHSTW